MIDFNLGKSAQALLVFGKLGVTAEKSHKRGIIYRNFEVPPVGNPKVSSMTFTGFNRKGGYSFTGEIPASNGNVTFKVPSPEWDTFR